MEKYNFDFDLSAARLGREVRTKTGKLVTIVSFDANSEFSIVGIVHLDAHTDYPVSFNHNGIACGSSAISDAFDLVCPVDNYDFGKANEYWVNAFLDDNDQWYVRAEKMYRSRAEAELAACNVDRTHKSLKVRL